MDPLFARGRSLADASLVETNPHLPDCPNSQPGGATAGVGGVPLSHTTENPASCRPPSNQGHRAVGPRYSSTMATSQNCSPATSTNPRAFKRFTKRSEEHTSELQSQSNLVCRLL